MTFHSVYILWLLLPTWFFLYGIWAFGKRFGKRPIREHPEEYFIPGLFTGAGLLVAIWLDQTIYEELVNTVTMGMVDVIIARWLLYPAILLVMAYGSKFLKRKPHVSRPSPAGRHMR